MGILINEIKRFDDNILVEYCNKHPEAWVHHKGICLIKTPQNKSFVLSEGKNILAICPYLIEKFKIVDNIFKIGSMFKLSLPKPIISQNIVSTKYLKSIKNLIFKHIELLSEKNNISKISYNFLSYNTINISYELCETINRYGYLDSSLNTLKVNLNLSIEDNWRKLSKGHRSIIKKYKNCSDLKYIKIESDKIDYETFKILISGITFFPKSHIQYLYILYNNGNLDICQLLNSGEVLGTAIFLKYKNIVQYHQAKRNTNNKIPVHHLIVWENIKYYSKAGLDFMDLGVFLYNSQLNYIDTVKKNNIAIFKRGFNTDVSRMIIGEKYFNKELFINDYSNKISSYANLIKNCNRININ